MGIYKVFCKCTLHFILDTAIEEKNELPSCSLNPMETVRSQGDTDNAIISENFRGRESGKFYTLLKNR